MGALGPVVSAIGVGFSPESVVFSATCEGTTVGCSIIPLATWGGTAADFSVDPGS